MVKVILDSSFLFIPFQFQVDIFDELEALLGRFEPLVLSTTLQELKGLSKKRSIKMRKQATAVLELADRCKIVDVERNPNESCVDVILRTARKWKVPVATNDSKLRRKLREAGVPTIFLRQKSYLGVEGHIPRLTGLGLD